MRDVIRAVIVAALAGEASPDEFATVMQWRAANQRNEEEYQRLLRLWEADLDTAFVDTPAPSAWSIVDRAAGQSLMGRPEQPHSAPSARADATIRAANPLRAVGFGGWAAAVAATLVVALGLGRFVSDPMVRDAVEASTLTTGRAQVARSVLDDGTIVQLAPESQLKFGGSHGDRAVTLAGRAFFAVAPNPNRPFKVRLPTGEIEVLGTRFDLESRDGEIQVAVVEGVVRMASNGDHVNVGANQVARSVGVGAPHVEQVDDVFQVIDWLDRFLAFQATPIGDVAAEIEHRLGIRIEVEDSVLLQRTFTGSFAEQTPGEMITGICRAVSARCTVDQDLTVHMEVLPETGP